MDLSIVILTWNSESYIGRCLSSIVTSLEGSGLSYEIHVVDNGSGDGTPEFLKHAAREYPGRLALYFLPHNLGTTVPRNLALRKARGRYLCVMDSDVEVGEGVFTRLVAYLQQNPPVGLAVPRIFYPSGLIQKSCDRFPTLLHKAHRFLRLRSIEFKEAREQERVTESFAVDYAISAFWLFPAALLAKVGFLDEKIFYAPEDVDFCLRVWKAGYQIHCVPVVGVVHHTQEISRGWKLSRSKLSHLKGLCYLFAKHRYLFSIPDFKKGPAAGAKGLAEPR